MGPEAERCGAAGETARASPRCPVMAIPIRIARRRHAQVRSLSMKRRDLAAITSLISIHEKSTSQRTPR